MALTKDEWLAACAARFQARQAATSDDAWKLAPACFDNAVKIFGTEEGALASSPEDAADEEISCWGGS